MTRDNAIKNRILVLGATGAVGREFLKILAERGWPADQLRLVASDKSAGQSIDYAGRALRIESLCPEIFESVGLVFSAASADIAKTWLPIAVASGAVAIDNSSQFRHDPDCPLIVPEVNGDHWVALPRVPRIIANPNCSTILLLVGIDPLRRAFGVSAIDVCTYQAVSGAGLPAIEELKSQASANLNGQPMISSVFPEPCAFNVFSHESKLNVDTGLNAEEQKIIDESRRIWEKSDLRVTPTCVRVPVVRAHSQAVTISLNQHASLEEIQIAYRGACGVRIVDDRASNRFPTPLAASGGDEVLVGRFRPDPASPCDAVGRSNRWCLFLSGDQLRKGAALNALQIADLIGWNTTAAAMGHRARSLNRVLSESPHEPVAGV